MKELLGPTAVEAIAAAGVAVTPEFDSARFRVAALDGLGSMSIMKRMRHIGAALTAEVRGDPRQALDTFAAMGPHLTGGFQAMAVSDAAARMGHGHPDAALSAIAALTRYGTGEFAVRPFLAVDPGATLARMRRWADDSDEHVRRLASEGSRPRLPWAARVPALRADPTLASPILEALKADPSPYVRKSVANHLNDIAKDQPDWVVARLSGWSQDVPATRWIVRHALRTLIKSGDARALALIGARDAVQVAVEAFTVSPATIAPGDTITIAATLLSRSDAAQKLVVDYRVLYARAGGRTSAKVFKLRTFTLPAKECATLSIRQTIRDFSTRRHHPGAHAVDLLVNGVVMAHGAFLLEPGVA